MLKGAIKGFICVFTFFALAASAYAQAPREQLKQMVGQLQKSPADNALREKIIRLAADLRPAPPIPPEARRPFVMAGTYQKEAKQPSDFALAIDAYRDALKIAPWWSDAYYNLSVSLESAGRLDEARDALAFYLLTKPKDAEEVQNRLYALDAKKNLAAAREATAQRAGPDWTGCWASPSYESRPGCTFSFERSGGGWIVRDSNKVPLQTLRAQGREISADQDWTSTSTHHIEFVLSESGSTIDVAWKAIQSAEQRERMERENPGYELADLDVYQHYTMRRK